MLEYVLGAELARSNFVFKISRNITKLSIHEKKVAPQAFLLISFELGVTEPVEISLLLMSPYSYNTDQSSPSHGTVKYHISGLSLLSAETGKECSLMFTWLDIRCFFFLL